MSQIKSGRAPLLAFLLAAIALAAPAIARVETLGAITPAGTVAHPPPVPNGVYLGMYCNTLGKGATKDQKEQCTENLEHQIGRPFAVQTSYFSFSNFTESEFLSDPMIIGDLKFHRIPLVSQSCGYNLDEYRAGGAGQASIDNALTAMKAYPGPVIFTWFHEFNSCVRGATKTCHGNNDNPNCFTQGTSLAQKQAQYKAAWAFLAGERARLGATNVALGWRPTNARHLEGFYPGDSQVDWILPDAYDRNGAGFAAMIGALYNEYCTPAFTSRPCGLAEFGEAGCSSYGQAQFMRDIESQTSTQFRNIHLLAWYNAHSNPRFDWRIDNCGGIDELRKLANMPQFKAMAY